MDGLPMAAPTKHFNQYELINNLLDRRGSPQFTLIYG